MRVLLVSLLVLFFSTPAFATYDDVTVVSVAKNGDDTVTVVANFAGTGEAVAQRSKVFPWNYTDDTLTEWSVSTLEKLNGLKVLSNRIKATDKLSTVRPIIEVIP